MKVLHINTGQVGGAALCAIRISQHLLREGVDSRMLIAESKTLPQGIKGAIAEQDKHYYEKSHIFYKIIVSFKRHFPFCMTKEKLGRLAYEANVEKLSIHIPLTNYTDICHHPLVEWADVIHLHWVAGFIDYPSFFKNVKKPIVWTLHDKYPAVGIMHFDSDFFPVPKTLRGIDRTCKKIKRKALTYAYNLNVVAISELMVDICNNSDVLKDFPVTLIHNGVDTNVFKPYDKQKMRKSLNLPATAKIFLFSACDLYDSNKGLLRAIEALEKVDAPNKMLVCIGYPDKTPPDASFPIVQEGIINSQSMIAQYYSASDFFLQCSYEESFSQTLLEAMACGTPVVSTRSGVAPELIHPFNGILCDGFDSDAIISGIRKALSHDYDATAIRQYILNNYQYEKIAKQYINLYKSVLSI